jgi:hypothetical protein
MIEYRVLSGASAKSLEEQVADLANNDGYIPQGGVSVYFRSTGMVESALIGNGMIQTGEILFSQAMVKIIEEKK